MPLSGTPAQGRAGQSPQDRWRVRRNRTPAQADPGNARAGEYQPYVQERPRRSKLRGEPDKGIMITLAIAKDDQETMTLEHPPGTCQAKARVYSLVVMRPSYKM
jgi:hypothetical protein